MFFLILFSSATMVNGTGVPRVRAGLIGSSPSFVELSVAGGLFEVLAVRSFLSCEREP